MQPKRELIPFMICTERQSENSFEAVSEMRAAGGSKRPVLTAANGRGAKFCNNCG
jgi:hypothetical protein